VLSSSGARRKINASPLSKAKTAVDCSPPLKVHDL
jgi:hypothetical protein